MGFCFHSRIYSTLSFFITRSVSSHVIWKIETFIEENTRYKKLCYIGQWCLSPLQSRHLGTSHSSPNRHQLLHRIFLNLLEGLKSLPFQRWFLVLGKARSRRAPNLGCSGAESPGWFDVLPKNCRRRDAWVGALSWWSRQTPVARSSGLLNHLNSFHRGMVKLNAKFDANSLLYSLILNVMTTQYTQQHLLPPLTSIAKSSLFMHAHSSPLFLAARLHWCHTNHTRSIKNGWTFSTQTLYFPLQALI